MQHDLQIVSAGKKVPLNEFARKVVLNTLMGLVGSLSDVDMGAEILITIRPVK
ncbi:MAG TPA: hypothetical protein VFB30_13305 [Spirochaetia bacterium]|nr:hypothetical protein [Spirochaetia bacterium]